MANNEAKVLTTNSFEDWRKKSNEVSYHLGDIDLLDARVGDKTYTYSASASQGIFIGGDSASKLLRFELAAEIPIDAPAVVILTGTPTIASNWVEGNTVYQGSVGSETFTGTIQYVNINKVALQNTTGTFSASVDLIQKTASTTQTIANANLVRIVSEAYDTGYVKSYDTNVVQPQTLTQVGFHVPNLAFTVTLTGSPAVLATFSEGAAVYQGSVGSETFTGTILNTTTGFVYLKAYTGTFNAGLVLKQSETVGDRIAAANLSSGSAVDASFGTLVELHTLAGASDAIKVISTNTIDALIELQDDIGTVESLTTTATDLVTAVNEHDAELGTISAAAMGTTASTVSTAINEHETQIGGPSTFDIDTTANTLVGALNEIEAVFDASTYEISAGSNAFNVTSDNFVIDSAGYIDLNTDDGIVYFKDDSTIYGILQNTSGNLIIQSGTTTMLTGSGANATFAGNLEVDGTGGFDGNFRVGGSEYNNATFTVQETTGNTVVDGTFHADGNATVGGTLDVDGNFEVGSSKFNVTASSGNTQVDGTFNVDSTTTLNGTTIDGALDLNGNADVSGNIVIHGNSSLGDAIGDTTTISGPTTVGGTFGVTGNSTLSGTLGVTGLTTSGSLTVTGATILNGGLTMDTNKFTVADTTGNTAIAGTLDVTGIVDIGQLNAKFSNRNNVKLALNELHDELGEVADINNATGYSASTAVTGITEIQGDIGDVDTINDATGYTSTTVSTGILEIQTDLGNVTAGNMGTAASTVVTAILEHQGDIGTVGNLTTTATSLTTAVNELDLKQGAVALGTSATTLSGAINELHGEINANDVEIATLNTFVEPAQSLNVGSATLADAINELEDDLFGAEGGSKRVITDLITANKDSIVDAINENHTQIGVIGNLNALITTDRTNLVTVVNELQVDIGNIADINTAAGYTAASAVTGITEIQGDIGNVTGLTTAHKTTLVGAINEHETQINANDAEILTLNNFVEPGQSLNVGSSTLADAINELEADLFNVQGGDKRTLASLTTTDKTSIVDAINEVQGEINSNDSDIAARLIKDTSSAQTLTGPITYGNGSTARTFTFAGSTTLDLSNATVLYSAAGGIQSSGSAFLNLDATAQSGSNVAVQGLQVDRTAISGGAATHDVRLQWNEGRVSADPEEAWELVGMNTSGTTDTSSILTRYNAFNLIANNTESGISVTWDSTNENFDFNVADPIITLGSGPISGNVTITNLGNATFNTTLDNNSVTLGTHTTGNYISTITGTANEIIVAGSGSETAGVTLSLPDDVTIGDDLTVTSNATIGGTLLVQGNVTLGNATSDTVTIAGNLTVQGDTTTLNVATLEVEDILVMMGTAGAEPADKGFGIETRLFTGTSIHATPAANVTGTHSLVYNTDTDRWEADGSLILSSATFDSASINSNVFSTDKNLTFSGSSGVSMASSFSGNAWTIGFSNSDKGSSQNIFKTFTADSGGSAVASSNTDILTIAGGTSLASVRSGDEITLNHANYGSAATYGPGSEDGGYIRQIITNAQGHVTSVTADDFDDRYNLYVHPTHPGDDFSIDTGALTGAVIVSDVDINVTTDTLGHVTDANAAIATRTLTLANLGYTGSTTANNYTHPSYNGDDFSVDTGALSGAVIVSDIDINLTSDGFGHVVDANGSVATRTLTLADLGYTGTTNANTYVHPGYATTNIDTSGATIIDSIATNSTGHITAMATRVLTLSNLGYSGAVDANKYVHATHPGDDFSVDSGPLTGANVISDIDINITTDGEGHVTDANASINTRAITKADLGVVDYNWNIAANGSAADVPDGGTVNFTDSGATTVTRSGDDINIYSLNSTYSSGDFNHDNLSGFVTAEHIDWTEDQGSTNIHAGNYTNTNTTYSASSGVTLTGTNFTHTDTSSLSNVNNSGNTFIQDLTFDTFGHVTGATSVTAANDNTVYDLYSTVQTNPYLTLDPNSGANDVVRLVGGGATTVTGTAAGSITISSTDTNTDTNTTYSHSMTQQSGSDADPFLRLTAGGDGSGNDDIELEGGNHITVTRSNNDKVVFSSDASETAVGTIVKRAASTGNFSAGTITATLNGQASTISGQAASATTNALNASNISSGTLAAARVATLNQNTTGSSGSTTGTAALATAVNAVANNSYNGNRAIAIVGTSGSQVVNTNSGVYMHPLNNYVYATDFIASSDERLKDIIEPITGALDKVCAIDGFLYTWNDKALSGDKETVQVGVSAQAVQAVLPEAVDEGEDGYLGVKYDKLVPLLIEAVKELKSDNEELRASIEELKSINR